MLSHTAEYALRATLHIARESPRFVSVGEVARAIGAPSNYLSKVLGQLSRQRVLDSSRGRGGGFRLASGARDLSLANVVSLLGATEPHRCLLGHGLCGSNPQCPVHGRWAPVAAATSAFFASTTLGDLLQFPEARATPPSIGAFHPVLSHT